MTGQGSPRASRVDSHLLRRAAHWAAVAGLLLCALNQAAAAEPSLRVRISWGGGEPRQWQGVISISEGELLSARPLGLEADEPGSMFLLRRRVIVNQPSPRTYAGLDLAIDAPLTTKLKAALSPRRRPDIPDIAETVEISLSDLIQEPKRAAIDKHNNAIHIQRAPGDKLRIRLDRDSLVFSPGEKLTAELVPHRLSVAEGTTLRFRHRLLRARSGAEVAAGVATAKYNGGRWDPARLPIKLVLPADPGAYDLVVTAAQRGFIRESVVTSRTVQLVVVADKPPEVDDTPFTTAQEIDPTSTSVFDLSRLSPLRLLPGYESQPLDNGKTSTWKHRGAKFSKLSAGGFQAYPLSVSTPGQPHILEVEYPADVEQTLSISVLEPNAAGVLWPITLDSGVEVTDRSYAADQKIARHRLIFWPRTAAPLLLLANRRESIPAVFGKIRILAGPRSLKPQSPVPPGGRMVATYYGRPLFAENFLASETLDEAGSLDDWVTFHEAGARLVQYLRHTGYGGCVLPVYSDGSALYPSRLLEATPRYDTGVLRSDGADPIRKDVVEMMLRQFDAAGLKAVLSVQFSAPLPELENLIRRGGPAATGVLWIDDRGRDYLSARETQRGLAPYYNPLNPRVQDAMQRVVAEMVDRYGHHESFGGLAIELSPHGFAVLPGSDWGYDDRTVADFAKSTGVDVPDFEGRTRFAKRAEFLSGEAHPAWLRWRAERLTALYARLRRTLAARRPKAKLMLSAVELLSSEQLQVALRPALPSRIPVAKALLEHGIDTSHELFAEPGVVFARPRPAQLRAMVVDAPHLVQLAKSAEAAAHFPPPRGGSTLVYHPPRRVRLPEFDAVSPFGKDKTYTWLVSHIVPAGATARRELVRALVDSDSEEIFIGGWMPPMGQEGEVRGLINLIRRLPRGRFEEVRPADVGARGHIEPLVVRRRVEDGKTFYYVANDSPWPVGFDLKLSEPTMAAVRNLSADSAGVEPIRKGDELIWIGRLQPYGVAAIEIASPRARLVDWQVDVPEEVADALKAAIKSKWSRIASLHAPEPMSVLDNAGFENDADGQVPGWVHSKAKNSTVKLDKREFRTGTTALKMESRSEVAWVRSAPFEPPRTGRVSVWVWLKVDDAAKQPPLRLAIEGRRGERVYYRFAAVGKGSPQQIREHWAQYIFQVDDLPTEGLSQLRVGFDLMGPGEVWIDDVEVYDLSFSRSEITVLQRRFKAAEFDLKDAAYASCLRHLDGYWGQFLRQHVPAEKKELARLPDRPTPAEPAKDPSVIDRLRSLVPRWPKFR